MKTATLLFLLLILFNMEISASDGYTSYKFDITPFCHPAGEPNVIAEKV